MNISQVEKSKGIQDTNSTSTCNVQNNQTQQAFQLPPMDAEENDTNKKDEYKVKSDSKEVKELIEALNSDNQIEDQQSNTGNVKKAKIEVLKKVKELAINNKMDFKLKNRDNVVIHIHNKDASHRGEHKLDISSLQEKDIKFLKECLSNPNIVIDPSKLQLLEQKIPVTNASNGQVSYKSVDFSKGLGSLIEYAYKTQRPVRLDFDGNSSVILQIDDAGKLSAQFISSNKAMETLIKNNLPNLRQKFDSEGLPYSELSYKESNKEKKEQHGG